MAQMKRISCKATHINSPLSLLNKYKLKKKKMSLAQWRQFNFFDKQQATDPIEKGKTPAIFQVTFLLIRRTVFQ